MTLLDILNPKPHAIVGARLVIARGETAPLDPSPKRRPRTHCPNKHEFTIANTVVVYGKRRCLKCHEAKLRRKAIAMRERRALHSGRK
jgi:hypothetical protein